MPRPLRVRVELDRQKQREANNLTCYADDGDYAPPPLFNHDLSLVSFGKDPAIQTFAVKGAIEALDEGIFPGTIWRME